jgi:hypothetical protein
LYRLEESRRKFGNLAAETKVQKQGEHGVRPYVETFFVGANSMFALASNLAEPKRMDLAVLSIKGHA